MGITTVTSSQECVEQVKNSKKYERRIVIMTK